MSDTSLLVTLIKQALKQWHEAAPKKNPLAELFLYRRDLLRQSFSPQQINNRVLSDGLRTLLATTPQLSDLLRMRFIENKSPRTVADALNISEPHLYRLQGQAFAALAEVVHASETSEREQHRTRLQRRLIAPVHPTLVGLEQPLATLSPWLTPHAEPWLIAIEGIGGVGKTALAHHLMERLLTSPSLWDGLAWVTAAPTRFDPHGVIRPMENPALHSEAVIAQLYDQLLPDLPKPATLTDSSTIETLVHQLRRRTCLIVIDNLETLSDVEQLLPLLRRLVNPSKIVLTSRENRFAEPGLAHFPVPELSEEDALRLLRQSASHDPASPLAKHNDDELHPIYELVGGNPLALHLIAGQLYFYDLDVVLADLRAARGASVQNLYTFVYRRAWDHLDLAARKVLLMMPLVSGVAQPFERIAQQTGLDASTVRTSFSQLLLLNLVQVSASSQRRSYTLHSLTRTFLLEQVIQWQA